MSLILKSGLDIGMTPFAREMRIDNRLISREEFVSIVEYFLENADLSDNNDERLALVQKIQSRLQLVNGFNEGHRRFKF